MKQEKNRKKGKSVAVVIEDEEDEEVVENRDETSKDDEGLADALFGGETGKQKEDEDAKQAGTPRQMMMVSEDEDEDEDDEDEKGGKDSWVESMFDDEAEEESAGRRRRRGRWDEEDEGTSDSDEGNAVERFDREQRRRLEDGGAASDEELEDERAQERREQRLRSANATVRVALVRRDNVIGSDDEDKEDEEGEEGNEQDEEELEAENTDLLVDEGVLLPAKRSRHSQERERLSALEKLRQKTAERKGQEYVPMEAPPSPVHNAAGSLFDTPDGKDLPELPDEYGSDEGDAEDDEDEDEDEEEEEEEDDEEPMVKRRVLKHTNNMEEEDEEEEEKKVEETTTETKDIWKIMEEMTYPVLYPQQRATVVGAFAESPRHWKQIKRLCRAWTREYQNTRSVIQSFLCAMKKRQEKHPSAFKWLEEDTRTAPVLQNVEAALRPSSQHFYEMFQQQCIEMESECAPALLVFVAALDQWLFA